MSARPAGSDDTLPAAAPAVAAPPSGTEDTLAATPGVPGTDDTVAALPAAARRFDAAAETLGAPAGPTRAPPSSGSKLALELPEDERYEVAGELARGGLGRILRAHDRRLRRPVALKALLRAGGDAEARFLREALITARLQHPSIIPLYDAARGPDGEVFYSMKLVSGRSLEEAIQDKETLAERLSLLPHAIDVAEAIAYAHSRRVIHRDLKPQNVLVGEFGETVVIDWGIAKDLSAPARDDAPGSGPAPFDPERGLTLDGAVMGTPAYMPPEQARGEPVDERADVYALGALLYHLLAGVAPYEGLGVREILLRLLSSPPVPPAPLSGLERGAPRDLAAVVTKAMAPAPGARYPSARELAEDLKKFQTGQIVGAYHYTARELAVRFVRRHRLVLALLAVLALGAVVSVVSIVDQSRKAEQGRLAAEHERQKAAQAEARERRRADEVTLQQARLSLEHDPQKTLDFLAALSPSFGELGAARIIAADALSRPRARTLRGHEGGIFQLAVSRDGAAAASASYDRTARVWDVASGQARVLRGHTAEVVRVAFAPDGKRAATVSYDRTARVWDLATGEARVLEGHTDWLRAVTFTPDGRWLLTGGADGTLRVWDPAGGAAVRVLAGYTDAVGELHPSPDGARLYAVAGGVVRAWDLGTGASTTVAVGVFPDSDLALSPDGARMATAGVDGGVRVHELPTGRTRVLGMHEGVASIFAFSPDGRRLASAGGDAALRIWDVDGGVSPRVFRGHEGPLGELAWSPDGRLLVSGGADGTVRVWDAGTGSARVLRGHQGKVEGVAFAAEGRQVVSAGADGTVRLWAAAPDGHALEGHASAVLDLAFFPGGQRLASLGEDRSVRLWDVAGGPGEVLRAEHDPLDARAFALSRDGGRLAAAGADRVVRVWDVAARPARLLHALPGHEDVVRDVAFAPDAQHLCSVSADGTARVWDLAAAAPSARILAGPGGGMHRALYSPDGRLVAGLGRVPTVMLWDAASGEGRQLRGHESLVLGLAFSPDGARLASAGLDRTVRIWDTRTGEVRVFAANEGGVYHLAFSPQGDLLAAGCDSGAIRVFTVATGESRVLRAHDHAVVGVRFSPDGRTLASTSSDGTARLWDVASGESRAVQGAGSVRRLAFSPGGGGLALGDDDGKIRVVPDDLPHDPAALRARLQRLATPMP